MLGLSNRLALLLGAGILDVEALSMYILDCKSKSQERMVRLLRPLANVFVLATRYMTIVVTALILRGVVLLRVD